jgi:undecaprenyl-diphosphatase
VELDLWKICVLAVVQGITEFLPISSDGHLAVVMPLLFGGTTPKGALGMTIVLHMGTLLSIIIFYRQRIWELLRQDWRTIIAICVATIPAVIFGFTMKKWGQEIIESPLLAGFMLPVTGLAMLFAHYHRPGKTEYQQLTLGSAWWIGVCQAFAILPGLSRSGSTIACGVGVGLTRPSAATFSFLLAIPALAGAGLLETIDIYKGETLITSPLSHLLLGAVVSFIVGMFALSWLMRVVERGKLHYFAYYCFVLGALVITWQLWPMLSSAEIATR